MQQKANLEHGIGNMTATHCDAMQLLATKCNSLQHTATYCNMQQTASWDMALAK